MGSLATKVIEMEWEARGKELGEASEAAVPEYLEEA